MVTKTIMKTKAIFEEGVFRPLDDVTLPESQVVELAILPLDDDSWETLATTESDEPVQETLADVLGFDPDDEEKSRELAESQHRAVMALIETMKKYPGSEPPHDGSTNHDKYIYQVDW